MRLFTFASIFVEWAENLSKNAHNERLPSPPSKINRIFQCVCVSVPTRHLHRSSIQQNRIIFYGRSWRNVKLASTCTILPFRQPNKLFTHDCFVFQVIRLFFSCWQQSRQTCHTLANSLRIFPLKIKIQFFLLLTLPFARFSVDENKFRCTNKNCSV